MIKKKRPCFLTEPDTSTSTSTPETTICPSKSLCKNISATVQRILNRRTEILLSIRSKEIVIKNNEKNISILQEKYDEIGLGIKEKEARRNFYIACRKAVYDSLHKNPTLIGKALDWIDSTGWLAGNCDDSKREMPEDFMNPVTALVKESCNKAVSEIRSLYLGNAYEALKDSPVLFRRFSGLTALAVKGLFKCASLLDICFWSGALVSAVEVDILTSKRSQFYITQEINEYEGKNNYLKLQIKSLNYIYNNLENELRIWNEKFEPCKKCWPNDRFATNFCKNLKDSIEKIIKSNVDYKVKLYKIKSYGNKGIPFLKIKLKNVSKKIPDVENKIFILEQRIKQQTSPETIEALNYSKTLIDKIKNKYNRKIEKINKSIDKKFKKIKKLENKIKKNKKEIQLNIEKLVNNCNNPKL